MKKSRIIAGFLVILMVFSLIATSCTNDAAHESGKSARQLVRLRIAKADGQAGLGITVHKQNLFTCISKADAQIDRRCGLANAAFLIG